MKKIREEGRLTKETRKYIENVPPTQKGTDADEGKEQTEQQRNSITSRIPRSLSRGDEGKQEEQEGGYDRVHGCTDFFLRHKTKRPKRKFCSCGPQRKITQSFPYLFLSVGGGIVLPLLLCKKVGLSTLVG